MKADPIVRVEAGRLRGPLGAYYEAQGGADPILILLPKGHYVPEFMERGRRMRPREPVCCGSPYYRRKTAPFESFAVSRDGRKLAFTASLNGRMRL